MAFIQQQGDVGREFLFKAPGKEVDAIETYLLAGDAAEALRVLESSSEEIPDRWFEAKKLMDMGFDYEIVNDSGVDYMWWYKP